MLGRSCIFQDKLFRKTQIPFEFYRILKMILRRAVQTKKANSKLKGRFDFAAPSLKGRFHFPPPTGLGRFRLYPELISGH